MTRVRLTGESVEHARHGASVQPPRLYLAWGVAWLVSLGAMWLDVRGQHPYRSPGAVFFVLLAVLLVAAIAFTVITMIPITRRMGAQAQRRGQLYGVCWPVSYLTMFFVFGALGAHGASAETMGLVGAAVPMLLTAVLYAVGGAVWLDRMMFATGCWLALVTAVGVWAGPAGVLLVEALAGGGGFLLIGGYLARGQGRRRFDCGHAQDRSDGGPGVGDPLGVQLSESVVGEVLGAQFPTDHGGQRACAPRWPGDSRP